MPGYWTSAVSDKKIAKMFMTAIKRALKSPNHRGESNVGNRRIVFTGHAEVFEHFYGRIIEADAVVCCYYYNTAVFEIDFIKKRVTNFGMRSYSPSTATNIGAWEAILIPLTGIKDIRYQYGRWIAPYASWADWEKAVFHQFRSGVAWLEHVMSVWWFQWDCYNEDEVEQYRKSVAFLKEDQNWRYWTYAWKNGEWTRQFINTDAQRRWNVRQGVRKMKRDQLSFPEINEAI